MAANRLVQARAAGVMVHSDANGSGGADVTVAVPMCQQPAQPQLANLVGCDIATRAIEEFVQAAPGIPWSVDMLDDLLEELEQTGSFRSIRDYKNMHFIIHLVKQGINKSCKRFDTMLEGQITVYYQDELRMTREEKTQRSFSRTTKQSPCTRKGLITILQDIQREVNKIKQRGFCDDCLTNEPPRKKLCVRKLNKCGGCGLNQIYHE